jgi:hypothetical protein
VRVDSTGNLVILDHAAGSPAWWIGVSEAFFPLLVICWLLSLASQVLSYRRSSWDRRQQLKWLMSGSAVAGIGILVAVFLAGSRSEVAQVLGDIATAGILAIPVGMGVAIMKYRLFDIDRIISRTLAYAIVTGLLVGVSGHPGVRVPRPSSGSRVHARGGGALLSATAPGAAGGRPTIQPRPV